MGTATDPSWCQLVPSVVPSMASEPGDGSNGSEPMIHAQVCGSWWEWLMINASDQYILSTNRQYYIYCIYIYTYNHQARIYTSPLIYWWLILVNCPTGEKLKICRLKLVSTMVTSTWTWLVLLIFHRLLLVNIMVFLGLSGRTCLGVPGYTIAMHNPSSTYLVDWIVAWWEPVCPAVFCSSWPNVHL